MCYWKIELSKVLSQMTTTASTRQCHAHRETRHTLTLILANRVLVLTSTTETLHSNHLTQHSQSRLSMTRQGQSTKRIGPDQLILPTGSSLDPRARRCGRHQTSWLSRLILASHLTIETVAAWPSLRSELWLNQRKATSNNSMKCMIQRYERRWPILFSMELIPTPLGYRCLRAK